MRAAPAGPAALMVRMARLNNRSFPKKSVIKINNEVRGEIFQSNYVRFSLFFVFETKILTKQSNPFVPNKAIKNFNQRLWLPRGQIRREKSKI